MTNPVSTSTLGLLERLAKFTERRHTVLATNVAHATTPNYERRDLDVRGFEQALKQSVDDRRRPSALSVHSSRHTPPVDRFSDDLFTARADTQRNVRFHDAGVRSIETEMTELTGNKMLHDFAVEVMNAQFAMLESVVTERL